MSVPKSPLIAFIITFIDNLAKVFNVLVLFLSGKLLFQCFRGMKSILESLKHICPYWKNLAHYKEIFSLIPEK